MTLLRFYFTLILRLSSSSLIKSVTLTPSNPTTDGATIACTHSDCSADPTQWSITSSNHIGFHLQIDLDHTWGFHSDQLSTISLTMYGGPIMNTNVDLDGLFVFSVANAQYITHWLSFDQTYSNTIYPARGKYTSCDTTNPKTPLASGNIKECVLESTCNDATDRGSKTTGGDEWGFMQPQNLPRRLNAWPMTIQLTNDPIKHQTHTTITTPSWGAWAQGCAYNQSFRAEQGLQIYIATDDIGETITFSHFNITYEYDSAQPKVDGGDGEDVWLKSLIMQIIPYLMITLVVCCLFLGVACLVRIVRNKRYKRNANDSIDDESSTEQIIPNHNHALDPEILSISNDEGKQLVKKWLSEIELTQYWSNFIDNGYDSLRYIESIPDRDSLKRIGIDILGHQIMIMTHVNRLKGEGTEEKHIPKSLQMDGPIDQGSDSGEMVTMPRPPKQYVEDNSIDAPAKPDVGSKSATYVISSPRGGPNYSLTKKSEMLQLWAPEDEFNPEALYTDVGNSWMSPEAQLESSNKGFTGFTHFETGGFIG